MALCLLAGWCEEVGCGCVSTASSYVLVRVRGASLLTRRHRHLYGFVKGGAHVFYALVPRWCFRVPVLAEGLSVKLTRVRCGVEGACFGALGVVRHGLCGALAPLHKGHPCACVCLAPCACFDTPVYAACALRVCPAPLLSTHPLVRPAISLEVYAYGCWRVLRAAS